MHFEEQYPNKPPGVKFISTMFHPNVYSSGELCLDILQNRWSPTYDVAAILTSIQRYVRCEKGWKVVLWVCVWVSACGRVVAGGVRRRVEMNGLDGMLIRIGRTVS